MFDHYILCRYNVALYSSNPYKVKNPNEWMDGRVEYFNRLISSLEYQTNDNFTFVVALDENTPLCYKSHIQDVLNHSKLNTITIYKAAFQSQSEWFDDIEVNTPWLITSRVDNDDEYFSEFVETIQNNFNQQSEILDVQGLQCLNGVHYTSGRDMPNSPFISLVEQTKELKTVFYKPHSTLRMYYPPRFVGTTPLYIQHIHDNNQMNKIIGAKL